jgi:hypothetical protein
MASVNLDPYPSKTFTDPKLCTGTQKQQTQQHQALAIETDIGQVSRYVTGTPQSLSFQQQKKVRGMALIHQSIKFSSFC